MLFTIHIKTHIPTYTNKHTHTETYMLYIFAYIFFIHLFSLIFYFYFINKIPQKMSDDPSNLNALFISVKYIYIRTNFERHCNMMK